ncbi:hypothetical protein [Aneurinibacillus tyrosinisolvens]|uniref:hypothetical protein n=1 Tax=Aneurinibacillus tyrosinisolvens TaxID=1443435 RepID=UPI00063F4DF9|nr:hypothetical protein [Aneurinibacillus tyrosinisolvens]
MSYETLIRITDQDHELVEVSHIENGINVGRKRIKTSELVFGLLDTFEGPEVFHYLSECNDEDLFAQLGRYLADHDGDKLLEVYADKVSTTKDYVALTKLFRVIAQQIDVMSYDAASVSELFELLCQRISQWKDCSPYYKLLATLLTKLDVNDLDGNKAVPILRALANKVKKEEELQVIEETFLALAEKARPLWVRQALSKALAKENIRSTPMLPPNCIHYQELVDGTQVVLLKIDSQRFDVQYHNTKFEGVHYPTLLFEIHFSLNRVTYIRCFAMDTTLVKPDSRIYLFPFSNVYNDGHVCWKYSDMKIKDLAQVGSLPFMFLNSPANDHLYRGKVNLREWYTRLQYEEFDNSMLTPTRATLKDLLEQYTPKPKKKPKVMKVSRALIEKATGIQSSKEEKSA